MFYLLANKYPMPCLSINGILLKSCIISRADEEPVDPKKYLEELCKPKCVKPLLEYKVCESILLYLNKATTRMMMMIEASFKQCTTFEEYFKVVGVTVLSRTEYYMWILCCC